MNKYERSILLCGMAILLAFVCHSTKDSNPATAVGAALVMVVTICHSVGTLLRKEGGAP